MITSLFVGWIVGFGCGATMILWMRRAEPDYEPLYTDFPRITETSFAPLPPELPLFYTEEDRQKALAIIDREIAEKEKALRDHLAKGPFPSEKP